MTNPSYKVMSRVIVVERGEIDTPKEQLYVHSISRLGTDT